MEKSIFWIIITTVLFGNQLLADTSGNNTEFQLAQEYFSANNYIVSSMYAEKYILEARSGDTHLKDLTLIYVESKKELGELSFAADFLKKNQEKISLQMIQNSESYLFDQDIYHNEFGNRLLHFNSLKKKTYLENDDLKELTAKKEIKELDQVEGKKKPWIAATLSGIVPGAGQVYNGNYQAAAASFLFNALLLFSAIEFHQQDLDWPAATAGLLFSMTYAGNIISSGRDAVSKNNSINTSRNQLLKSQLLPELSLSYRF